MSYGMSAAVQEAVYGHLYADADLIALVGDAVFDAAPPGGTPAPYVTLGPEDVRGRGAADCDGAVHDFTVSVVSEDAGFQNAKTVAAAVSDALVGAPLSLSRGRLIGLGFLRARARRIENGAKRQIDLRFRARVEDD